MEEITAIRAIASLEAAKAKRTYRRGQITKLKSKLDEIQGKPLRDGKLSEAQLLKQEIHREVDLHNALQTQYEVLLAAKATEGAVAEEECAGEDLKQQHRHIKQQCQDLLEELKHYQEALSIQQDLDNLDRMSGITTRMFEIAFSRFAERVSSCWRDTAELVEDSRFKPLRATFQDAVSRYMVDISKMQDEAKQAERERLTSPVVHTPRDYSIKFDLELPTFSGKPTDWRNFYELFSSTLKTRGKSLHDKEKRCLLLKAMKTEEAKEAVLVHSHGEDGYDKAIKALINNYGSSTLVYPHHVRELTTKETYSYDRDSLRRLRRRYLLNYEALKDLNGDTLSQFLAAMAFENFDSRLRDEWTKHTASKPRLPTLEEMFEFLEPLEYNMAKVEPITEIKKPSSPNNAGKKQQKPNSASNVRGQCPLCKEYHTLAKCSVFATHNVDKRTKIVKDHKRCFNCLSDAHTLNHCTSPHTCRHCHGHHHSLLHKDQSSGATEAQAVTHAFVGAQADKAHSSRPSKQVKEKVTTTLSPPELYFVETAIVNVTQGDRQLPARAALDSGSGVSLMSERLASHLKLPRYPQRILVEGAYGGGSSKHFVQAELRSLNEPSKAVVMKFSVIPKLKTSQPPRSKGAILDQPALSNLKLADPDLGGPLDLIICSVDRCRCVTEETKFFPDVKLAATNTIFGWTITGPLNGTSANTQLLQSQPLEDPLQRSLERLWELDQVPDASNLTQSETRVVQEFHNTHQIKPDGRYSVVLPRVLNPPAMGGSRNRALQRFLQNEKSLERKGQLEAFNKVLQEYKDLGHAETVPPEEQANTECYYLPVHGVFKESSTTTKVRAVFDASAKTTTGVSLNDTLETGPNFYPLLPDVLVRFRSHRIGLSSDISKMFREILLDSSERDLHRFFQRDEQGMVTDCRMKRLTFGVKSSPYIATQVIRHLAESHSSSHPKASRAVLEDFYVDDFLSGADTVQEADLLRKQLCELLLRAGMTLRKWRTSSAALRSRIPEGLIETKDLVLTTSDAAPKALGIHWDVANDCLHVSTPLSVTSDRITKRTIASDTAKVFDILGLFAPALLPARVLLQALWKLPLKWDDLVPDDVQQRWKEWASTLSAITDYAIPRRFTSNDSPVIFRSLHGFSDASSTAYGAAVYLRLLHEDSSVSVSLVITKARVLPVKAITIPRAELVAAQLLSKLLKHVASLLLISQDQLFAWTDSMIVLCWLQKPSASLKTFVANRVASIQEALPSSHWRHVPTDSNPADLLSRGMDAQLLVQNSLWWKGPPWLALSPTDWPANSPNRPPRLPEIKVNCNAIQIGKPTENLWNTTSSFHHLTRILAWARRFLHNCRGPRDERVYETVLTSRELTDTQLLLIRLAQRQSFPEVYDVLLRQKSLPRGHHLSRLDVSLDCNQILKVSSRVRDASSPRQPKALTPLSLESEITRLLIATLHKTYSHPGIAALLSIIGDTYYVPGLRNFLKKTSRNCPTCQRAYARPLQQQMGLLPSQRTTPSPPFYCTGIDFEGPFQVRRGHTRKPVIDKTYACLFVCLSTRAVHLELCAELSSQEFLAALRRFAARRGCPAHIYSDNGTNFQGAQREIKELQQLHYSTTTRQAVSHLCTETSIQWHFIPPRSPHFGGLWEAGVRSMKTLLRKLVTPHHLRYDELYTLLTEVEAILNSRPIAPINTTDVECPSLTPGHFLIGRPLKSPPTKDAGNTQISSLRRWSLVNRLSQDLWKDWLGRYLQSLHHRTKWTSPVNSIKVDDLVFIKDEVLRYRNWPLAKVTEVHSGDDGKVRAVDLLCHGKVYRRAIHRLIPLFQEDDNKMSSSSLPPEDVRVSPEQGD